MNIELIIPTYFGTQFKGPNMVDVEEKVNCEL